MSPCMTVCRGLKAEHDHRLFGATTSDTIRVVDTNASHPRGVTQLRRATPHGVLLVGPIFEK